MSGICNKLKPCPICGSEPVFQHFNITPNVRGRIICSCGLEIRQGANDTEDDLRIIWNTRAERTCKMKLTTVGYSCSVCHSVDWTEKNKPKPNYCPNCGARVVE